MAGIIILAEKIQTGLELITRARNITGQLQENISAFSLGSAEMTAAYQRQGLDEILLLAPLENGQGIDAYEELITAELARRSPGLVLMASSPLMRNLAPRLAEALDAGLVSDCASIAYDSSSGAFQMERTAYGGTAIEVLEIPGQAMATVPAGSISVSEPVACSCTITEISGQPASPIRIIEQLESSGIQKNLSEADSVICAGRGFEKAEDLDLVRTTAGLLGAELACTRPLTEELNWLPSELCVGLSGQNLKAGLCLEVGISGQIQHLTGIKDCQVICSINKDENALVFKASDYGIAGDLYEIMPALNEAIKELKNQ